MIHEFGEHTWTIRKIKKDTQCTQTYDSKRLQQMLNRHIVARLESTQSVSIVRRNQHTLLTVFATYVFSLCKLLYIESSLYSKHTHREYMVSVWHCRQKTTLAYKCSYKLIWSRCTFSMRDTNHRLDTNASGKKLFLAASSFGSTTTTMYSKCYLFFFTPILSLHTQREGERERE